MADDTCQMKLPMTRGWWHGHWDGCWRGCELITAHFWNRPISWYNFFDPLFFECLSSGCSHSICPCTCKHTHQPHHIRMPHSHPTHTIRPTTLHRIEDRVLLVITGNSVDDGDVVLPLWLHAWEDTDLLNRTQFRCENPGRAGSNPDGECSTEPTTKLRAFLIHY
jgi:hypothetical protein